MMLGRLSRAFFLGSWFTFRGNMLFNFVAFFFFQVQGIRGSGVSWNQITPSTWKQLGWPSEQRSLGIPKNTRWNNFGWDKSWCFRISMEGRLWSFMGIFTCTKIGKTCEHPIKVCVLFFYRQFKKYMLIKLEHFPKFWGENPTPKMKPPS